MSNSLLGTMLTGCLLLQSSHLRAPDDAAKPEISAEQATSPPDNIENRHATPSDTVFGAIDQFIEQKWSIDKVTPVENTDDAGFHRRLSIDLLGRIPTPAEKSQFLASQESNKREALIDSMLQSPEHATHLAEVYDAILIGRTGRDDYRKRVEANWFRYLERSIAENKPWDKLAEEILLARNESEDTSGANWYLFARNNKPQDIAESVSKDFFGVRIDCAQCHDHPLASEIGQRHYWGLVAFFNRSKNVGDHNSPRLTESAIGGFSDFTNIEGESAPNKLVFLGERAVEEARPASDQKEEDSDELYLPNDNKEYRVPNFSRREQFVKNILNNHPLLAQSMVNRMWGWMMGRGIVHPVDKIDSFHPASHPELLAWLTKDFEDSGYDVRRLVKNLAMTRAYQLQSKHSEVLDPASFAAMQPKPLTAETYFRSILTALEVDTSGKWNKLELRVSFAKLFPDVLTEESMSNVSQSLLLTNGQWLNQIIQPENSKWVASLVNDTSRSNESIIAEAFDRLYGREPDRDEIAYLVSFLEKQSESRERAICDLVWALLTNAEFRFNH